MRFGDLIAATHDRIAQRKASCMHVQTHIHVSSTMSLLFDIFGFVLRYCKYCKIAFSTHYTQQNRTQHFRVRTRRKKQYHYDAEIAT